VHKTRATSPQTRATLDIFPEDNAYLVLSLKEEAIGVNILFGWFIGKEVLYK